MITDEPLAKLSSLLSFSTSPSTCSAKSAKRASMLHLAYESTQSKRSGPDSSAPTPIKTFFTTPSAITPPHQSDAAGACPDGGSSSVRAVDAFGCQLRSRRRPERTIVARRPAPSVPPRSAPSTSRRSFHIRLVVAHWIPLLDQIRFLSTANADVIRRRVRMNVRRSIPHGAAFFLVIGKSVPKAPCLANVNRTPPVRRGFLGVDVVARFILKVSAYPVHPVAIRCSRSAFPINLRFGHFISPLSSSTRPICLGLRSPQAEDTRKFRFVRQVSGGHRAPSRRTTVPPIGHPGARVFELWAGAHVYAPLALPCTHIIRSGQLQHAPVVQCGSRWLRWTFVRNRAT